MIKYRFAQTPSGVKPIEEFRDLSRELYPVFTCLGCGGELIARAKGHKVTPHFAHKVVSEIQCSVESYLHKLAKENLYKRLLESSHNGVPVFIESSQDILCDKYKDLLKHTCTIEREKVRFNLLQFYNNFELEKQYDGFRPDVLLTDKNNVYPPLFLEIAVTHFIDEQKEKSGYRTIEIPIRTEQEAEALLTADITEDIASFINFNFESAGAVNSKCRCAAEMYFCFIYFKSNKSVLLHNTMSQVASSLKKRANSVQGFILQKAKQELEEIEDEGYFMSQKFRELLNEGVKRGMYIKNCFLCRYAGTSNHPEAGFPVFCKVDRQYCETNRAAECEKFRKLYDKV